jgi:hypothetical protein
MPTIEDELWERIVRRHLPAGPEAKLDKKQQQDLSIRIQHWVAEGIQHHLSQLTAPQILKEWPIQWEGKKNFLGAVRWQEVDVWIASESAGLVLAVDPKHFQSKDSVGKNWKNGHNDLIAFASNLHERFPTCAVGGVIALPEWAGTPSILRQMHGICSRSIPRERPLNAYNKFEGFALAIYDANGALTWPFDPDSSLKPAAAFRTLAEKVFTRAIAIL